MAIVAVQNWLSGPRDYLSGKALYDSYGENALLKTLFACGQTSYHFTRLVEALEEIAERPEPVQASRPAIVPELISFPVTAVRHSASDEEWSKFPDRIKDLFTKNSRLNARALHLFHAIRGSALAEDRRIMAMQMLSDREEINTNWAQIRAFRENGMLIKEVIQEKEKIVSERSLAELAASQKNLPPRISKLRRSIETMEPGPKRDKAMLKLQGLQAELLQVKTKFNESVEAVRTHDTGSN